MGAFSDKIQFSGTFTSDRDDLIGALQRPAVRQPDAPLRRHRREHRRCSDDVEGRKVVVAFTDGDDTASRAAWATCSTRRAAKETMIYAIGLESEFFNRRRRVQRTRPDRGLRKLADETGGGYFELKKTDELAPTFTRVAQELHSLYTHRLHAAAARQQGAQARGADEAGRHDRARAQELHRVRRASERQ